MLDIDGEIGLGGLGRTASGPDPLSQILASTRQYSPEIQKLFAELRLSLPKIEQPSVAVQQAVAKILAKAVPSTPVERAKAVAAQRVRDVVQRHESEMRKKISESAVKLQEAGVSRQEVEKRVKAAVERLPSSVARKAADEKKKTGKVSKATQAALDKAKEPIKKEIEKAAEPAKTATQSEADKLLQSLPPFDRGAAAQAAAKSLAEGRLDVNTLKQLGTAEGKKLLESYGKQYGSQALSKLAPELKIPGGVSAATAADLILSGKKITAESIGQAAYQTAKGPVEEWIKTETGIPIQLPSKISFKEIGGTFASVLPKDFEQALDLGLAIGSQAAAGALSAALAGTAIGSVIPGLGTVVGLAVGLAVFALKNSVKEWLTEHPSEQWICKNRDPKINCPKIPRNLSPIELLPWAAAQKQRIAPLVQKQKEGQKPCKFGEGPGCLSYLEDMAFKAYDLTMPHIGSIGDTLKQVGATGRSYAVGRGPRSYAFSTPAQMGLPEVNRLIALYERAPKQFQERELVQPIDIDPRAHGLVQGDLTKQGWRGQMDFVLAALKQRKAELEAFLKAQVDPYTPDTTLLKEIEKATLQYGLSRSENSKKWLLQVLKMQQDRGKKVAAAYKKRDEDMRKAIEQQKRLDDERRRLAARVPCDKPCQDAKYVLSGQAQKDYFKKYPLI